MSEQEVIDYLRSIKSPVVHEAAAMLERLRTECLSERIRAKSAEGEAERLRADVERLTMERDEARGGMVTLAKEGAELRHALERLIGACIAASLGVSGVPVSTAAREAHRVLERLRPDPEMVERIRDDLRQPPDPEVTP